VRKILIKFIKNIGGQVQAGRVLNRIIRIILKRKLKNIKKIKI
jgi:hypothetical protein